MDNLALVQFSVGNILFGVIQWRKSSRGHFLGGNFHRVIFQGKIACKKNPNVNNRGTRKGHIKNFLVTLLINFNIFLA